MRYCIKCVIPDTRPHIEFDEEGICSACQAGYEKEDDIDWDKGKMTLFNFLINLEKMNLGHMIVLYLLAEVKIVYTKSMW